ncbi:MAG: YigZ family protein [Mollicutes bacterium]|nr:YigZ family protein [Mollicutes bacterium]
MKLLNEYTYIVKKSKFIGYYYSLSTLDEVENILSFFKKEHKKATHVTYGYIFDNNQKKFDDGEPGGTAGMPILKILNENDLNRHLIVIVRYFGGTKLGAGGLIRAYLTTAKEVIKKS